MNIIDTIKNSGYGKYILIGSGIGVIVAIGVSLLSDSGSSEENILKSFFIARSSTKSNTQTSEDILNREINDKEKNDTFLKTRVDDKVPTSDILNSSIIKTEENTTIDTNNTDLNNTDINNTSFFDLNNSNTNTDINIDAEFEKIMKENSKLQADAIEAGKVNETNGSMNSIVMDNNASYQFYNPERYREAIKLVKDSQSGIIRGVWFNAKKKDEQFASKTNTQTESVKNETGKRYKIIPGSSFYGYLVNSVSTLHPNMKAIIQLQTPKLPGCKVLGNVSFASNMRGLQIDLEKLACNDGTIQTVSGIAVQMSSLKPVFDNHVESHIFPKLALITLSSLVKGIEYSSGKEVTTVTPEGNTVTTKDKKKGFSINPQLAIENNKGLIDTFLIEQYNKYQTEAYENPQAVVVIFY